MNREQLKHEVFINIAKEVSRLSHDLDTQVGCVIVSQDHRIVATGFNGFPKNWKDTEQVFLKRPEKHNWMIHAERNAIDNAQRDLTGCTAYITAWPCMGCLNSLWNKGVKTVRHLDFLPKMMDNEEYWKNLKTFKEILGPSGFEMDIIKERDN